MNNLRNQVADIPTKIDVAAIDGSGSLSPLGGRTHSVSLDYTESANRILRQLSVLMQYVQKANPNYDADEMAGLRLQMIASALNSILIRAFELEDPVLKAVLASIGLLDGEDPRPIRLTSESTPPLGLDPDAPPPTLTEAQRSEISAAIRSGVHHAETWLIEASLATLRDPESLEIIGRAVEVGATSGSSPLWRLWVES